MRSDNLRSPSNSFAFDLIGLMTEPKREGERGRGGEQGGGG